MKYGVYSIRDQLVGYMNPTVAANDDAAIRYFTMLVNDPSGTMVSSQPQYFDFYKIGEFDLEKGTLTPFKELELLVTGLSVKKGDYDGRREEVQN